MTKNAKMKYKIQTAYIDGLPYNSYRNGKPEGVVMHETANPNSTIDGEISYMSNHWADAFVHAFVGNEKIVETANTDYAAWGAGPYANQRFIHVELVRYKDKKDAFAAIDRWCFYTAFQLYWYDLNADNAEADGKGTIWSHNAVSKYLGGTDHTDPMAYLKQWDITWNQVADKVKEYHKALLVGDSTKVLAIGEAKKVVQKAPAKTIKKVATSTTKAKATITSAKVYTVKQGDNLWRIAVNNKVDFEDLLKWNNLKKDSVIAVGQKLKLSTGAVKQKAPAKVTNTVAKVVSPNQRTRKEMLDRLNWYVGKYIDFDNVYEYQCMDVAVDYIWYLTKGTYKAWGNARDLLNNYFPQGWKIYENTTEFLPQVGDIAVYTKDFADNEFGHVALVYANPTLQTMVVVEQNWNGKADLPCKLRTDNYTGVSHFIRPAYIK